ncbi:MAG: LacI family DNA-binding transcriptional regulator [Phycisphaeraceae bacterium JB051]
MSTLAASNQVTLADVAAKSGVSTSSVSKVLNLQPEQYRMSDQTRQRILEAVAELGYRPNFQARSLAKGRSHNIGILFEGSLPTILRDNESGMLSGLEPILSDAAYQMVFIPIRQGSDEWKQMLSDRRVDACLVVNQLADHVREVLEQLRIPAVLVNGLTDESIPTCNVDNVGMAKALTEHLLELGHQRIWMYTNIHVHKHHSVTERETGYQQAMSEAGLADQANSLHMEFDAFVQELVQTQQRPTAIVVYQHLEAVRLLQACWRHDIKVPDQLSVATFNNAYPAAHVIPPLTTMALPMVQMGEHAARLLLEMIEEGSDDRAVRTIPRFAGWHLVVRESTTQLTA